MNDQALQITPQREQFSLVPRDLGEAMKFADLIAGSDLVPKDYKGKPANVVIAMQMGMEIGLPPLQAIQQIAVINGRPAVWGDAMLAIVKNHRDFGWIDESYDESTKTAICKLMRKNQPVQVRTFSEDDARAAGLLNKDGPWKNYRKRMQQLRARGFALRDVFPDALRGLRMAEEERDAPRDMGDAERLPPDQEPPKKPAQLPVYDQQEFEAKLDSMKTSINAGKTTPENIISKLSTKYTLTEEQKQKITGLAKKPEEQEQQQSTSEGWEQDYERASA